MKLFNPKISMALVAGLCAVLLFSSCEKNTSASQPSGENLDMKIAGNTNLSIFQAALKKTRLNIFTQGGGPFTILAPTNMAFKSMGINTEADLNTLDSNLLVQIITYHIQTGSRSYNEIPLGPNATMTTQGGFTQYASRKVGGSAYINGGQITEPNIQASNGFMHVINKVLVPPFFSMAASFALLPQYKLMMQAFTKTATNITTNPLTIFAVPNSVMIAEGYDSTSIANATGATLTTLTSIMKYHTVNKRIFSPDFIAGGLKTVQGNNVEIASGTVVTVKGINNPTPFQILSSDYISTTGVVHAINGLLKP